MNLYSNLIAVGIVRDNSAMIEKIIGNKKVKNTELLTQFITAKPGSTNNLVMIIQDSARYNE